MSLSIAQFFDRLRESGVLAPEEVESLLKKIPREKRGQKAEKIVPKLVEAKKLTPYQAEAILAGNQATLVLGDYVVLSKIGAGGMGQVFKARHRRMKRLVALKVLPSAVTAERESVLRFQREVEAAARLSHPNIVQAHDAGEQKGIYYLVMEFVDGSDLAVRVKRHGPLPCGEAIQCVVQAARGLAHAHAQGVVHRDIKPANLLLDENGIVKILDMGLARFDESGEDAGAALTQSGTLMGTVDYMSPEQALDTKSADARADIYSLGCTLYFLLSGKRLYEGETMMKRLVAHRNEPIPSLTAVRKDLPPGLDEVFERMVAKKPQDRFQTMNEVSAALLALCSAPVAARSVAAPGDATVGRASGSGTFATGVAAPPPAPPPLVAANTVTNAGSRTRQEVTPELLPVSFSLSPRSTLSGGPGPITAAKVWRVFDTPLWAWAAGIDRWFAQLAGPGNTTMHMALRVTAGGLATVVILGFSFLVWNLLPEGTFGRAKPSEKIADGTASNSRGTANDKETNGKSAGALGTPPPAVSPPGKPLETNPPTESSPVAPAGGPASLSMRPLAHTRVRQGQAEILKVTVERVGCAGPVEVKVSGLPEKVTCLVSTIYATQDSLELRFSAAADAPLGDSYATVAATLGEHSTSRLFRLSVDKAAGLRMSPLADKSLKAGETLALPVQVARDGYTGPIQLTVAGLPTGVKLKGDGATILPGSVGGVLEFTAAASAPVATYNLRVSAAGGGFSDSQPLRLAVESGPTAVAGTGGTGAKTTGSTVVKRPASNLAYEFDPDKKDLPVYTVENLRAAYEGKNYVLEVGRGSRTNTGATLGESVTDFDCEARCRLTGTSGGIRMTLVFRDAEPPPGEIAHLTWWINRYDQACLVRQNWDVPKPGVAPAPTRETRITNYEDAPQLRHDVWNKIRLRARGPLVETFINDKLFRNYTVGAVGYKPAPRSLTFWITKDNNDESGRLEISEIKVTRIK